MSTGVALRKNVNPNGKSKVYFFWRSLEYCDRKYLEPFIGQTLDELENEMGISHSGPLNEHIEFHRKKDVPMDPMIPFLLGDKEGPQVTKILDFLEQDLFITQHKTREKENAFIDLCVVLGDQGRAKKCAGYFQSKPCLILESLKENKDGTMRLQDIMTDTLARFHTSNKDSDTDSGFLTTLIYYVIEHISDSTLTSKISAFWWLGYHWDAICLGAILLPGNRIVETWKTAIETIAGAVEARPWIAASKHVIKLKNGYNDTVLKDYSSLDNVTAYRILKVEIAMLHNGPRDKDDLIFLSQIQAKAHIFRELVARLLISSEPCFAEDITCDAVAYIKRTAKDNWIDYFPQAHRVIFEPAVKMISYLVAAFKSLRAATLGKITSERYDLPSFGNGNKGFMNKVVSYWLNIPMGEKIWHNLPHSPHTFGMLCSQLLSSIGPIEADSFHKNMTALALNIASIMASGDMSKDTMQDRVEKACKTSGLQDPGFIRSFYEFFATDFDPNPYSWDRAAAIHGNGDHEPESTNSVENISSLEKEKQPNVSDIPSSPKNQHFTSPESDDHESLELQSHHSEEPKLEEEKVNDCESAEEVDESCDNETEVSEHAAVGDSHMGSTQPDGEDSETDSDEKHKKLLKGTEFALKAADWPNVRKQGDPSENGSSSTESEGDKEEREKEEESQPDEESFSSVPEKPSDQDQTKNHPLASSSNSLDRLVDNKLGSHTIEANNSSVSNVTNDSKATENPDIVKSRPVKQKFESGGFVDTGTMRNTFGGSHQESERTNRGEGNRDQGYNTARSGSSHQGSGSFGASRNTGGTYSREQRSDHARGAAHNSNPPRYGGESRRYDERDERRHHPYDSRRDESSSGARRDDPRAHRRGNDRGRRDEQRRGQVSFNPH